MRPEPAESQMAVNHQSQARGRLTNACLMAVRKSVQGLLGNRCYKGREPDRAADSKPVTR